MRYVLRAVGRTADPVKTIGAERLRFKAGISVDV